MSDDSFGQDFVWYEWGFVSPEDLPRDDLDVKRETRDSSHPTQSVYVHERSEVWSEWQQ